MLETIKTFFSNPLTATYEITLGICIFRILLSFFAGSILGFERKSRLQALGMRTLILICVSSCLLMMTSIFIGNISNTDRSRIAAQVVSGIGFLGGGAILRQGLNIKGLTSAAIIWTIAAIGLGIGLGLYIPAFFIVFLSLISLVILEKFESKVFPVEQSKRLILKFKAEEINLEQITDVIQKENMIITGIDIKKNIADKEIELIFGVKVPFKPEILHLPEKLLDKDKVLTISLTE